MATIKTGFSNQQFINIMNGIRAAYPRFKIADSAEGMELWRSMLSDISYESLSRAVQTHISSNEWPPSIADIRKLATQGPVKDWGAGWSLVLKAIRRHGSYGEEGAMQELKEEDNVTWQVVKRLGFRELCYSENIVADRSNFRTMYEQVSENLNFQMQLPERLRREELQGETNVQRLTDTTQNNI